VIRGYCRPRRRSAVSIADPERLISALRTNNHIAGRYTCEQAGDCLSCRNHGCLLVVIPSGPIAIDPSSSVIRMRSYSLTHAVEIASRHFNLLASSERPVASRAATEVGQRVGYGAVDKVLRRPKLTRLSQGVIAAARSSRPCSRRYGLRMGGNPDLSRLAALSCKYWGVKPRTASSFSNRPMSVVFPVECVSCDEAVLHGRPISWRRSRRLQRMSASVERQRDGPRRSGG